MQTFTVEIDGTKMVVVQDDDGKFIVPDGWRGIGTALKPACEPICLARKPIEGTNAENVLRHGTGALNIDGCRIDHVTVEGGSLAQNSHLRSSIRRAKGESIFGTSGTEQTTQMHPSGRWPANVVHDGSDEVLATFPVSASSATSTAGSGVSPIYGEFERKTRGAPIGRGDRGSAARFFYSAKADADDRLGSKPPTVKPVDLMRWLVRLVTPPGGTVLDPFAGSGTTGMACLAEGFDCILVERQAEYVADIKRRVAHVSGEDTPLFATVTADGAREGV
jgi:site-specific DNA-methyltransferase (adenine-specific)